MIIIIPIIILIINQPVVEDRIKFIRVLIQIPDLHLHLKCLQQKKAKIRKRFGSKQTNVRAHHLDVGCISSAQTSITLHNSLLFFHVLSEFGLLIEHPIHEGA